MKKTINSEQELKSAVLCIMSTLNHSLSIKSMRKRLPEFSVGNSKEDACRIKKILMDEYRLGNILINKKNNKRSNGKIKTRCTYKLKV